MNPVINIEHLKRYRNNLTQQFAGVNQPVLPDPCNSDMLASPEWEVEDIVAWRRNRAKNNHLEFLLQWKGYGPTEDSWASEFDLHNARDLLQDYQAQHPDS